MENGTRLGVFSDTDNNNALIRKIYFVCLVILIPVTIIGNVLVSAVVFVTPKLRKEPMYVFLTSLAVADFLVGALSMPIRAKIEWDNGQFYLPWVMCWIFNLAEIILSVASTIHLFIISADRYFAIKYTYEYKILMCRKIHLSVLLFIWTFSVVWSILGIFQWNLRHDFSIRRGIGGCFMENRNYFTTTYILCFIAPACLILFIYYFIYKTTKGHMSAVSVYDISDPSMLKEKNDRNQQFKRLYSIIIVFTAYAVCWMPCVVLILVIYYYNRVEALLEHDWFLGLRFLFINFLPHFNSSLNPFLYIIYNKEFNTSLRKLFFRLIGNKLVGSYSYRRRNRFSMPADLRGILYSDDEDDGFELEVLSQASNSPPRRRFTL